MEKRKNYKVMAIATFYKNFDIKAENEEEAKRAVRARLREDGGDSFTEENLISENYAVAVLPEAKEEEPELTDEEYERFDRLHDAFYDFCLMWDDNEKMADDMDECFEQEITPFDPDKLFEWKTLFNTEIKKGRSEYLFCGGEKLYKRVTLIDVHETREFDTDGQCSSAHGYELWLTDRYEFVTTRYAEMVERDENGKQVLAMRYRTESDKDFYDYVGAFRSEDFFDVIKDKIEESKSRRELFSAGKRGASFTD